MTTNGRLAALRPVSLHLEELEPRTTPSLTVVPHQFTTNQYTALNITQSQLLAGDSSGSTLTATILEQPNDGTLVNNDNGTFTFRPNPSFSGTTAFPYQVGNAPTQLFDPGAAGNDDFGESVAIDGNTAVVGARFTTVNGQSDQGVAYVFVRSGAAWVEQAQLAAADGGTNDFFGYSVSVSGDTIVVGAYDHDHFNGAAYVFVRAGAAWSQQAELTATDGTSAGFGSAVSISGDTALIGAPEKTVNGNQSQGAAYVFTRTAGAWSQQAEFTATDGSAFRFFGNTVSVSDDVAVVGITFGINPGAAYAFVRSGSTWSSQTKLVASDAASADSFGDTVSASGDTVVVGSSNAGYVFVYTGGAWQQQAKLAGGFGVRSVAVSGATAVLGSGSGVDPFERSGNTWTQVAQPNANNSFDSPVALSGTVAIYASTFGNPVYVQDVATAMTMATIQVNPATAQLFISPTSLPNGTAGHAYASGPFTATGGAGSGYTFQQSGLLPTGLTFDAATGKIVGTPAAVGLFSGVIIAASDGKGGSGSFVYGFIIKHDGVNGMPIPYPLPIYAPPTARSDPNAASDAFIRGLYHSILDRDVENPSALTFWATVFQTVQTNPQALGLSAGTDPYLYVAQRIWNSPDHRGREVTTYYQDFLGRNPVLAEQQYWVNQFLFAGATEADVVRGFLTSAEFLYDHRADPSLAATLNQVLLGGGATATDLQTWTADLAPLDAQRSALQSQTIPIWSDYKARLTAVLGSLDDEQARTGVLVAMLGSTTYRQAALDRFYQAILRRPDTAAEAQAWFGQGDANGQPLTLGAIATRMLAAPEYRGNPVNSVV